MSNSRLGLLLVSLLAACAPKNGTGDKSSGEGTNSNVNTGAQGGSTGLGGAGPLWPPPNGQGGELILGPNGASGGGGMANPNGPDACGAVAQEPEQVVVYHDATVVDTIVTYKPIALYIMQDRSSSMVGVAGDPSRWPNSQSALTAFVNDPGSAGLDVGIGFFPPMSATADPVTQGDCTSGADCGTPVVPIGPLPANSQPIIGAIQAATPPVGFGTPIFFTPTRCAIAGMLNECARFQSTSPIGEKCVAVLVTDGEPTLCLPNGAVSAADPAVTTDLVALVSDAAGRGVTTFAVALPGAQAGLSLLQAVAQAGGTTLIDLTNGGSSQALLTALNSIRETVVTHETSQVVTTQIIETKLDCQWTIPAPKTGTFDKTKVNVKFTAAGATASYGHVSSPDQCAAAQGGNGWYYDNEADPKQVLVCPATCETIKASTGGRVDLEFGCETVEAKLQ